MKTTVDLTLNTGLSLAANFNSVPIEASRYTAFSVQVIFDYTGGATSAGSFSIQQSNDGVTWATSPSSTQAAVSTNSSILWNIPSVTARYVRVAYTYASGTGGTASILAHATM